MSKSNENKFEVEIKAYKEGLAEIFKSFFVYYLEDENFDINSNIQQHLDQSEALIIIIKQLTEENQKEKEKMFFICFKNTVIITKQCYLKTLQKQILYRQNLPIFIIPKNDENICKESIDIQDDQIKSYNDFEEEIDYFKNNIKEIILKQSLTKVQEEKEYIKSCISGYLIQEAYAKTNRNQKFIYNQIKEKGLNIKPSEKNNFEIEEFDKDEFINLNLIGSGSSSKVYLSYHIKKRKLFVIKVFKENNDDDYSKLIEREIENYQKIDFPLLPKFYGKIKNTNSFVIQFIDGETLLDIEENKLNDDDAIFIIFELILIIEYLHENHFVYRDLKPNNVIIDENKNIYVIDFDRMINIDDNPNDENHTASFTLNVIFIFVFIHVHHLNSHCLSNIFYLTFHHHYHLVFLFRQNRLIYHHRCLECFFHLTNHRNNLVNHRRCSKA